MQEIKYKKILGLDLGSNSIGFSLITQNINNNSLDIDILEIGTRIYDNSRDPKSNEPINVKRRQARGKRRQVDRTSARIANLMSYLIKEKLYNKTDDEKLFLINPYEARSKSAKEQVDKHTLLRSLISLNKRRGYKSNAKLDGAEIDSSSKDSKDEKNNKDELQNQAIGIENLQKELNDKKLTLGQFLWNNFKDKKVRFVADENRKQKSESTNNKGEVVAKEIKANWQYFPTREMYKDEFNVIKQIQGNSLITDAQWSKIEEIIFYQRNLQLQIFLIGECEFFDLTQQRRINKIQPAFEKFRLWQFLNNLTINKTENLGKKYLEPLSNDLKKIILEDLTNKQDFNLQQLKKLLIENLKLDKKHNLITNFDSTKKEDKNNKLPSLKHTNKIKEIFKNHNVDYDSFNDTEIYNIIAYFLEENFIGDNANNFNEQNKKDRNKKKTYRNKYITDLLKSDDLYTALDLYIYKNAKDHASLSFGAITGILAYLQQGLQYDKAVVKWKEEKYGILGNHTKDTNYLGKYLHYYGKVLKGSTAGIKDLESQNDEDKYGKINNPTVHVILNQLRKVVNELVKKHGQIDQVVIETARDIQATYKQKKEIEKLQNANEKLNKDAETDIKEYTGKDNDSKHNIDKYKLYKEYTNKREHKNNNSVVCVYCGEPIGKANLYEPSIQIDHIIPHSFTRNDTFSNKILACQRCNKEKSNQTPYDWLSNDVERWSDVQKRIEHLPRSKKRLFFLTKDEISNDDFAASQLNDTRYISKLALLYLQSIVPTNNVIATKGAITSHYKHYLELDKILEYQDDESSKPKNNDNLTSEDVQTGEQGNDPKKTKKKERIDHRHHAVDAFVCSLTTRSVINAINTEYNKKIEQFNNNPNNKNLTSDERNQEYKQIFKEIIKNKNIFNLEDIKTKLKEKLDKIITSYKPDKPTNRAFLKETAYGVKPLYTLKFSELLDSIDYGIQSKKNEIKLHYKDPLYYVLALENEDIKAKILTTLKNNNFIDDKNNLISKEVVEQKKAKSKLEQNKKYNIYDPQYFTKLKDCLNSIDIDNKTILKLNTKTPYYEYTQDGYKITETKAINSLKFKDIEHIPNNYQLSKLYKLCSICNNTICNNKDHKQVDRSVQHKIYRAFVEHGYATYNAEINKFITTEVKEPKIADLHKIAKKVRLHTYTKDLNLIKNKDDIFYKGYGADGYLFVDVWQLPKQKNNKDKANEYTGVFVSALDYTNFFETNKNKTETRTANYPKPHPAAKFVMRLYKGDYVLIQEQIATNTAQPDSIIPKIMVVDSLEKSNNRVSLRLHLKSTSGHSIARGFNTMINDYKMQKIAVDILGKPIIPQTNNLSNAEIVNLLSNHANKVYKKADLLDKKDDSKKTKANNM